jgi:hypothetical protein
MTNGGTNLSYICRQPKSPPGRKLAHSESCACIHFSLENFAMECEIRFKDADGGYIER